MKRLLPWVLAGLAACPAPPVDTDVDPADPCGVGDWGDIPVDDRTLFVRAGATGGDGTSAAPFGTIGEAVAIADHQRIAIAAGSYPEVILLDKWADGVTLAGRCAERVRIEPPADANDPVIHVNAEDSAVTLSGLSLVGGRIGLGVDAGAVTASHLSLQGNALLGVRVSAEEGPAATLVFEDGEILDTVPDAEGRSGGGFQVSDGASATVRRSRLVHNTLFGILQAPPPEGVEGAPGSTLVLEQVTIEDPLLNADKQAFGLIQWDGSDLTATDLTVAGATQIGLWLYGTSSLTNLTVRGTIAGGNPLIARGIEIAGPGVITAENKDDGRVEIVGGTFEDNEGAALFVDVGATATISGVTITRGTRPPRSLCAGALDVVGKVVADHVDISDQAYAGFRVFLGGSLTADEVSVTDVHWADDCYNEELPDLSASSAVFADGADTWVHLGGSVITDADYAGIVALEGAQVELISTTIAGIRPTEGSTDFAWEGVPLPALGAVVVLGATATLTDVDISNAARMGVEVEDTVVEGVTTGEGSATLTRVTITDVTSTDDAGPGEGLRCDFGAVVDWYGGTLQRIAGTAVTAQNGCTLDAYDLEIADVTATADDGRGGVGVVVAEAAATLTGLSIRRAALGGVTACTGCLRHADPPATFASLYGVTIDEIGDSAIGYYGGNLLQVSGIVAAGDAHVDAHGTTVTATHGVGIAGYEGARFVLDDVDVLGTEGSDALPAAVGVYLDPTSRLEGTSVTVTGTDGPGVYVKGGAFVCTGCVLDSNAFAGIYSLAGDVSLTDGSVSDTRLHGTKGGGDGVLAWGGALSLDGVAIGGQRLAGLDLRGEGSYQIRGSTIAGGAGALSGVRVPSGNAIFASNGASAGIGPWDGTSGLWVADNVLSDGVGATVLLDGAAATFDGNDWLAATGVLVQQACSASTLAPDGFEEAPRADLCVSPYDLGVQDLSLDLELQAPSF